MKNAHIALVAGLILAPLFTSVQGTSAEDKVGLKKDYNVTPVPFNHVHVDDAFWTPRLETSRKVTIPYAFEQCEETDRISNFEKAAGLQRGQTRRRLVQRLGRLQDHGRRRLLAAGPSRPAAARVPGPS